MTQHGPLRWVTFMKGRGFVTYQDLGDADAHTVTRLVAESVAYYRAEPDITRVEWKSRGHDHAPGLHEALINNGFTQDDPESIMIGEAQALSTAVPLPDGVTLRQVTDEADVRAMSAMQDEVFGEPVSDEMADALLRRLSLDDGMQLWVAEADGKIVSAGRLEPVPGTAFAGIWGGATREEWRGRGIYRALTARRAQAALEMGRPSSTATPPNSRGQSWNVPGCSRSPRPRRTAGCVAEQTASGPPPRSAGEARTVTEEPYFPAAK